MYISHSEAAGAEAAKLQVEALTEEVKVGKIYEGKVTSIKDFGAFIEILPGRDGLCHISELDDKYVGKVDDVCKVGDQAAGQGDRHRRARPRQAVAQGAAARAEQAGGRRRPLPAAPAAAAARRPRTSRRGRPGR